MNQLIACIILRGSIYDWYAIPFILAVAAVGIAARYWRFFVQWLNGIRGRDWAPVSVVIDVVSVIEQTEQNRYGDEYIVGYLATLTYFYRYPELQMGEYSRMFDDEQDAQAWAASYKGRAVMVHVDPRDPSHSVLRKEEL
jgi:hypothetical protein